MVDRSLRIYRINKPWDENQEQRTDSLLRICPSPLRCPSRLCRLSSVEDGWMRQWRIRRERHSPDGTSVMMRRWEGEENSQKEVKFR